MRTFYTVFTCGQTFDEDLRTEHNTAQQARKEARNRGTVHYTKWFILPNGVTSHWKHYMLKEKSS